MFSKSCLDGAVTGLLRPFVSKFGVFGTVTSFGDLDLPLVCGPLSVEKNTVESCKFKVPVTRGFISRTENSKYREVDSRNLS